MRWIVVVFISHSMFLLAVGFKLYLEERGTSIIFKGTVVWSEKDLVQVHCFTVLALICWPVVCQQTL